MIGDRSISQTSRLQLLEAPGGDGVFNSDGTVNVVVIRPCDGRGPGGRIYTQSMLEANAGVFSGHPSYLNHLDPKAQKASGKLRRGPEELAGELRDTRWHPTYTSPDDAKFGYDRGAVVGKFMPASDLVESLIRRIPGQLKLSINAQATGLRRSRRRDGSSGWLVEGIDRDPENSSVDLVTAAGAGGTVAALLEAVAQRDETVAERDARRARVRQENDQGLSAAKRQRVRIFGRLGVSAAVIAERESLTVEQVRGILADGGRGAALKESPDNSNAGRRPMQTMATAEPMGSVLDYLKGARYQRRSPAIEYRESSETIQTAALLETSDMRAPEAGEPAWRTLLRNRGVSDSVLDTMGANRGAA